MHPLGDFSIHPGVGFSIHPGLGFLIHLRLGFLKSPGGGIFFFSLGFHVEFTPGAGLGLYFYFNAECDF